MFRCRSLINLLITIICICISVPAYAAARAQITEGWYKIVPAHAQSKALDVGGAKTNPGANIQLWGYVGAPQQKFYVRHRGNNWYSIKAGNCDLYVDAQGGVPHNGENVHLWNWNGTDAQLWGFIDTTDGFNIYTKMQYNLVFDCEAGRGDDGTNVQLWERGNVAWHRWILIPVEAPGNNTSASNNSGKINNALSWVQNHVNQTVGTGQCVALIKAYSAQLGLNNPITNGNACDYATKPLQPGWTRVQGGVPQPGDILVYTGGKYGHVAICAGNNISFHQNMRGKFVEKKINWSYNHRWYSKAEKGYKSYWGYIRPSV